MEGEPGGARAAAWLTPFAPSLPLPATSSLQGFRDRPLLLEQLTVLGNFLHLSNFYFFALLKSCYFALSKDNGGPHPLHD